jgi:hypothetical protein
MTADLAEEILTEQIMVRLTPAQHAALKADAKQFGRKAAQSARFAIEFYLAATPPPTGEGTKNG